ncbi:flagellar hook-associated protein FlgK [Pyruvatibacter mobilis]|uniref:flagellar hook-associated protein FlgK n=1 Tax=Pyruvatibacter mobilis TaxID=1712261 RepID=UPI003D133B60
MSLTTALHAAVSGLKANQASVDLTSRNIANATTEGYTRKVSSQSNALVAGEGIGVSVRAAVREVDNYLLGQLNRSSGVSAKLDVRQEFLTRVDQLFGTPDGETSIASYINRLGTSIQDLATTPESTVTREAALAAADEAAIELNRLSDEIQQMRREAERRLSDAVAEANAALSKIHDINLKISANQAGSVADLQDERDKAVAELSKLMDIRTIERDGGRISVFTTGGNLLLDTEPTVLSFDEHPTLGPSSLYNSDPALRDVGTITLQVGNSAPIDLLRDGTIREGKIAGLIELRDERLVQAQAQLDEIAHNLAKSLSETTVASTAHAGPPAGFDIDVASLQNGDSINLTYTETPAGTQRQVTIIRVDDPASLPLDNTVTPNPNDQVIGVAWGGGAGAFATNLDAALAAAGINVDASNPAGTTVRIVDDGAGATTDIAAVSATVTATGLTGQGTALPLFVDGRNAQLAYTASQDGATQKVGFASRIALNAAVRADPSSLVVYSTTPATDTGDPTRPSDLLERLTGTARAFDPATGIGGTTQPFSGGVDEFARRIVSFQANELVLANRAVDSQKVVQLGLEEKQQNTSGVSIDTEMAQLLVLQNAYAANARVMSAVQEMMDLLSTILR